MKTTKEYAWELDQHLRTDTFPLGIKVIREEKDLPAKVRRPKRDMGLCITICQGISMARRYGWTVAIGNEDLSCPIAQVAFGFEQPLSYYEEGTLACGMYTETMEAAKLTELDVPKFSTEESGFVVVGPLARIDFIPDTVLVYGNSAQVMRLVAGVLYKRGGSIPSTFSARADCADIVIKTFQKQEPQVILPCNGDRLFGQTQDHEMAFTIPYGKMAELSEGLAGTHKGGIRYPIPHFLRYEAQFPPTYEELKRQFAAHKQQG
jgi:uncharacterized protein (DUF169 family)